MPLTPVEIITFPPLEKTAKPFPKDVWSQLAGDAWKARNAQSGARAAEVSLRKGPERTFDAAHFGPSSHQELQLARPPRSLAARAGAAAARAAFTTKRAAAVGALAGPPAMTAPKPVTSEIQPMKPTAAGIANAGSGAPLAPVNATAATATSTAPALGVQTTPVLETGAKPVMNPGALAGQTALQGAAQSVAGHGSGR